MEYAICTTSIALPIVFWAAYHYYKDRHLPEPAGNLVLCFWLGIVSFYIGRILYAALGLFGLRYDALALAETSLAATFAYSVLVIGLVEESAKLVPFLLVVLRLRAFDEPIDGIIYASFIALGFAAIENLQYAQFLSTAELAARGFAGPLVHIMFASIWAHYIGQAWLQRRALLPTAVLAFGATAALHGSYDFVVIALPAPALPAAALLVLLIWLWRMTLIRKLHAQHLDQKRE